MTKTSELSEKNVPLLIHLICIPKFISKMKESCPHQDFCHSNGSGMYVLVYNWAFIITLTYPEIGWDDVVA